MRVNWLNLALPALLLALFSTGCFGSHGGMDDGGVDAGSDSGPPPDTGPGPVPDAGPGPDAAPGCSVISPYVESLVCPATGFAGETVTIGLTLVNYGCCGGGEVSTTVSNDEIGEYYLESQMTICDCCDECDCIGPITETSVDVVLDPVEQQVIIAGEQRCEITIVEEPTCRPQPATEVRMPRAIYPSQSLTVSAISNEGLGCGCQPRVGASTSGIGLSLCECCDECFCIDAGYEASSTTPAPPLGEHRIPVDGLTSRELSVIDRGSCSDRANVLDARVVAPNPFASSPQIHWVVVTGAESTCCTEPRYAVESVREGNHFGLTARDCTPPVDCACVPPGPTSFEAWHPLGELAPGAYTFEIDGRTRRFRVP